MKHRALLRITNIGKSVTFEVPSYFPSSFTHDRSVFHFELEIGLYVYARVEIREDENGNDVLVSISDVEQPTETVAEQQARIDRLILSQS